MKHLYQTRRLSNFVRLDRAQKFAAIHTFLRCIVGDMEDPTDSVIYGPSTSNKIERWWRDLPVHERMELYFKHQLSELLSSRNYDPHCLADRSMLSYIFVPVIQRECDIFVDLWNSHRIRNQQGLELPTGVPSHTYDFPKIYGGERKDFDLTKGEILEVAELSGVYDARDDYLDAELRREFQRIIPEPEKLDCDKVAESLRLLKQRFRVG